MTRKSNSEIVRRYLEKYAEKDLDGVADMFAEDIVLRDWKIRVVGKAKAVDETRKNFESADSIAIAILATYENEDTVATELRITVDATEVLHVVDVIQVNAQGKISAIRAYVGRGDE